MPNENDKPTISVRDVLRWHTVWVDICHEYGRPKLVYSGDLICGIVDVIGHDRMVVSWRDEYGVDVWTIASDRKCLESVREGTLFSEHSYVCIDWSAEKKDLFGVVSHRQAIDWLLSIA